MAYLASEFGVRQAAQVLRALEYNSRLSHRHCLQTHSWFLSRQNTCVLARKVWCMHMYRHHALHIAESISAMPDWSPSSARPDAYPTCTSSRIASTAGTMGTSDIIPSQTLLASAQE